MPTSPKNFIPAIHNPADAGLPGKTQQAWDRSAQGWNEHTGLIRAWLSEASAEMLDAAQIGVGNKVLDIAAGAGEQSLAIAERVGPTGYILATDISPVILELAQKNAELRDFKTIETRVLDAQSLNLAGANFDAAVARLGLMFCSNPRQALEQIRRALKPGGHFAALVFSHPTANPCLAITMRTAKQHAARSAAKTPSGNLAGTELFGPMAPIAAVNPGHFDPFAPGSLMSLGKPGLLDELLHIAGFTNIKVRPISAHMRLSSVHRYIDFLRSAASPIVELLAGLSSEARERAWAEMAERLAKFNEPRGWCGPNELLLCSAQAPHKIIK